MSNAERKPRVLITSIGYAKLFSQPLDILAGAGAEVDIQDIERNLTEDQVAGLIGGFDALIAGLEPITPRVMDQAPDLKLIARVGIGIDSVDIIAARERGIAVTHTPDTPTAAVGEIAIAMMIDLLRHTGQADRALRAGRWQRFIGRRLAQCTVGVIGVGRIGKTVIRHLVGGFPGVRILANDIEPNEEFGRTHGVEWADKETIYRTADMVSIHVPKTARTIGLVDADAFAMMKPTTCLVNTARGGIVDEAALAAALREGRLHGAALDVYEDEPYSGELTEIDNCLFTCHMAGSSEDARLIGESQAAEEVANLIAGRPFNNPVAEVEYELAEELKAAQ